MIRSIVYFLLVASVTASILLVAFHNIGDDK
jgi:hypothetical protein